MRTSRSIPALLVILVLALLPVGGGLGSLTTESVMGTFARMGTDQAMPECSPCLPDDTNMQMCAQACLGFSAIIPDLLPTPSGFVASVRLTPPADRLADEKVAPEPRPPKASLPA